MSWTAKPVPRGRFRNRRSRLGTAIYEWRRSERAHEFRPYGSVVFCCAYDGTAINVNTVGAPVSAPVFSLFADWRAHEMCPYRVIRLLDDSRCRGGSYLPAIFPYFQ